MSSVELYPDFPKLLCPFERKTFKVDVQDFRRHGPKLGLRAPEVRLAMPFPNTERDMMWVFGDESFAVEKMHGTNLCVEIKDRRLVHIQNRKNHIDFTRVLGTKEGLPLTARMLEGVLHAGERKYLIDNIIEFGELLGPSLNQNIHLLPRHLWVPFRVAKEKLRYNSFEKYDKNYWGWSEWFRTSLKSMLYCRVNKLSLGKMFTDPGVPFTEGIVIYHKEHGYMCKLRRDMFFWYYCDKIHIYDLPEEFLAHAKEAGFRVKGYEG